MHLACFVIKVYRAKQSLQLKNSHEVLEVSLLALHSSLFICISERKATLCICKLTKMPIKFVQHVFKE